MARLKSNKALGCGCLSVVMGLIVIVVILGSAYLLNFALKPSHNKGRDYPKQYAVMLRRYPWIKPWADSLYKVKALRDTYITVRGGDTRFFAEDTTRLHALLLAAPQHTPCTAVLIPGYTDCAVNMLHIAYIYHHLMGMNILIPDLHANGKSGGSVMQMGWKDRTDVLRWIAIADSLYHDRTGHADIVVHGISMGAATTMNVAGETEAPGMQDVRCFVEDCGYTSVWDEFSYELDEMFGLPEFPLLYSASALCGLKYGWTFGQASPLRQVAKVRKPMLFIHGGNDTFVPTRMVFPLYNAKPAPKYLIVFHGSAHAKSYHDHRVDYEKAVINFVGKALCKD